MQQQTFYATEILKQTSKLKIDLHIDLKMCAYVRTFFLKNFLFLFGMHKNSIKFAVY